MRPDGWRKASAGLCRAEALSDAGQGLEMPRSRCIIAVKRVAAQIGLKAADVLLLDTLWAFTQEQDWQAGRRPIVWASNAYLMERTGFSLSTLKRHARKLAEFGVITFKDSPNGKRWGHRDAEGAIVEAYGFDLSPLSARVAAFEALAEEIVEERTLRLQFKRKITIARRTIRAQLEAFGQVGGSFWADFERLLARLGTASIEGLSCLAEAFADLQAKIEMHVTDETKEMNPREVKCDPHIQITTQEKPVSCNSNEKEDGEDALSFEPALIWQACPEFKQWAAHLGVPSESWGDMLQVSTQLRPMIGISDHAWSEALEEMGPAQAASAFALVFEKTTAGEVISAGGYFRGMVGKARAGELYLARSFFGRFREAA